MEERGPTTATATTSAPPAKPHILFVDDDEHILNALRNLLRRDRVRWDMTFALDGESALEQLEQRAADVVVSDMRMPGMDGAELLRKVRDHYPATARLVLSGYADRDVIIHALPVVHQFVAKPCEGDQLRLMLERTCALAARLNNERVRTFVGKIKSLPSLPKLYWALTAAIADPSASLAHVAKIIERDPAMSANVLRIVNSAYFGVTRSIDSVQDAIRYLGLELISALVLNAHLFLAMSKSQCDPGFVARTQEHSLFTAKIAALISNNKPLADAGYTTGIVHNIGALVLALGVPRYDELAPAASDMAALDTLEQSTAGVTHSEAGAYLLGLWGLPIAIVEAVAHHERPSLAANPHEPLLINLHIASAIAKHVATDEPFEPLLDWPLLETVGRADDIDQWRKIAKSVTTGE